MKYYLHDFDTNNLVELTIEQINELIKEHDVEQHDIKEKLWYHSQPENRHEQLIKFINDHMWAQVYWFTDVGDVYVVGNSPIQEFRCLTIGFDEDTRCIIDHKPLLAAANIEYIGANAELSQLVSFEETIQAMDDYLNMDWLQDDPDGQQEAEAFRKAQQEFIQLSHKHGGHCVSWAIEYDQVWSLIYTHQPSEADFDEWYNRLIIFPTY